MSRRLFTLWLAWLLPICGRGADDVPAIAVFDESLGLVAPSIPPGPRLRVVLWPDGRVVWSRDQHRGGPPYLSGQIEPHRIQELLERFGEESVFDARSFRHSWLGPDSSAMTIWLQSGARHARLQSWHEGFEENPKLIASSTGITALNGRNREDALRMDTPEYQRFRRVWTELRTAIAALLPKEGAAYTGSTALGLPK